MRIAATLCLLSHLGCDAASSPVPLALPTSFATEVVTSTLGTGGGFGENQMPDVVLGPPKGTGTLSGSTDTYSLGKGGEIVVGFGEHPIVDGPGADLVVFENAFYAGGDPEFVYAELGEVSVSADGTTWTTFPCDPTPDAPPWPGCAGWTPVDKTGSGGEAFDLAAIGVSEARFVKIRDVGGKGSSVTAGFDLDAVGAVYAR